MPRHKSSFSVFSARASARAEAVLSTHGVTYLFLCIYAMCTMLMYAWGFRTEFVKIEHAAFKWWISLARGAGYTLNLNCALVLLLASRLFLTALRDTALSEVLPLDKAFPMLHIVVAYTAVAAVVVHATFHFVWLGGWNLWGDWHLWSFKMSVLTGCLLSLVFLILFIFARPSIRKKNFRYFYLVHLVGATLFFALLVVHGMYMERPETYKWVVPALIVYVVDRLVRLFNMSSHAVDICASSAIFMDDNVLQLKIPKPFDFRPGQYAEILVPHINREWHPFTIASAQYEDVLSFYVKNAGDWTGALFDAFSDRLNGLVDDQTLRLRVRGPFGAPTQEATKYSRVFLISGGIGATPFASICKQLHHRRNEEDATVTSAHRPRSGELKLADRAEQRIRNAIGTLYDVDVSQLAPLSGANSNPNSVSKTMVKSKGRKDISVSDEDNAIMHKHEKKHTRHNDIVLTIDKGHDPSLSSSPATTDGHSTLHHPQNDDDDDDDEREVDAKARMEYVAEMLRVSSQANLAAASPRLGGLIRTGSTRRDGNLGSMNMTTSKSTPAVNGSGRCPRSSVADPPVASLAVTWTGAEAGAGVGVGAMDFGRHAMGSEEREQGMRQELPSIPYSSVNRHGKGSGNGKRNRNNHSQSATTATVVTEFEEVSFHVVDNEDDGAEAGEGQGRRRRRGAGRKRELSSQSSAPSSDEDGDDYDEDEDEPTSMKQKVRALGGTLRRGLLRDWFVPVRSVSDGEKEARQRSARLGDIRSNALLFLHSSRVTFLLALLYVGRMAVSVLGSIFKSGYVNFRHPSDTGRWVPLAYAILSSPASIATAVTVVLELSILGGAAFASTRRIAEVLMFGPANIALTAIEFNRFVRHSPGSECFMLIQYILAQTLTFALVVGRMWRAVGKKGLLYDTRVVSVKYDQSHIPDADFVWTAKKEDDDAWLRGELADVAMGDAVRLHRYVTQPNNNNNDNSNSKGVDVDSEERGLGGGSSMIKANVGRPKWEQLLAAAARDTRSDGVVGIFFCGPEGMGRAIRKAAQKIEVWSNLRDAYLRNTDVRTLMRDVGLKDAMVVQKLRGFGCRVRFVYHEENFS